MNTTLIVSDDGVLTFTEEILQETGWKEGDMLEFIDNGDSFILRLVDES
jgi:bifunctional DNA-binding transcriptional regulator/antitoxin component of YhaV-PrlF toxin-antitoxin module